MSSSNCATCLSLPREEGAAIPNMSMSMRTRRPIPCLARAAPYADAPDANNGAADDPAPPPPPFRPAPRTVLPRGGGRVGVVHVRALHDEEAGRQGGGGSGEVQEVGGGVAWGRGGGGKREGGGEEGGTGREMKCHMPEPVCGCRPPTAGKKGTTPASLLAPPPTRTGPACSSPPPPHTGESHLWRLNALRHLHAALTQPPDIRAGQADVLKGGRGGGGGGASYIRQHWRRALGPRPLLPPALCRAGGGP